MDSFGSITPLLYIMTAIAGFGLLTISLLEFTEKIYYPKIARYFKENALLTPTERKLYYVLGKILNGKYIIFSKVRVGDIIGVKANRKKRRGMDFWNGFDPLTRMHADFVICDKFYSSPLLVIELDDKSHIKGKTKRNDKLKNRAYKTASMPILRINPEMISKESELSSLIKAKLINH